MSVKRVKFRLASQGDRFPTANISDLSVKARKSNQVVFRNTKKEKIVVKFTPTRDGRTAYLIEYPYMDLPMPTRYWPIYMEIEA